MRKIIIAGRKLVIAKGKKSFAGESRLQDTDNYLPAGNDWLPVSDRDYPADDVRSPLSIDDRCPNNDHC